MARYAAAALCLTLLVACNGEAERLTKKEYVAQADRLCRRFDRQVNRLGSPSSFADAARLFERAIEIAERTADDFRRLRPPQRGQRVHDALLSALEDSTDQVREAKEAVEAGDPGRTRAAMEEAVRLGGRADARAQRYGFRVCGSEEELGP